MITQADYYLFSYLGFIVLLLIAILGILYCRGRAIGRLEGQISSLGQQMRDMTTRTDGVDTSLTGCVVITPEEVAAD